MFNTFDFNLDLHNNNNIYHVFNNFYIIFNIQIICILISCIHISNILIYFIDIYQ